METTEKIYVGSGKQNGEQSFYINISICLDDIEPHVFEYNGKRYAKLVVGKKKETDMYGKTHYVRIDTFKPEQQDVNGETRQDKLRVEHQMQDDTVTDGGEELPF